MTESKEKKTPCIFLNVKALVVTFNQEKAIVGAFSVIVKTDGSFAALLLTFIKLWSAPIAQVKERRGRIKRDYFVNWTIGFKQSEESLMWSSKNTEFIYPQKGNARNIDAYRRKCRLPR